MIPCVGGGPAKRVLNEFKSVDRYCKFKRKLKLGSGIAGIVMGITSALYKLSNLILIITCWI
jgi:hypothetical protein